MLYGGKAASINTFSSELMYSVTHNSSYWAGEASEHKLNNAKNNQLYFMIFHHCNLNKAITTFILFQFHCSSGYTITMVLRKEINRGDIIFNSSPFVHVLIKDKR